LRAESTGRASVDESQKAGGVVATLNLLESPQGIKGHTGETLALTYTPDGAYILSSGWDGKLILWDAAGGVCVSSLTVGSKPISACAVSHNGHQWVAGSMEGLLSFWDSAAHNCQMQFVAHTRPISSVCYSPDGSMLATTSWDKGVSLRLTARDRDARQLQGHHDIVGGCRFFPDGRTLLTWSHDRTVRLWNVESGQPIVTLSDHKDRVLSAAVSPDGEWLASASRDGEVILWNAETRNRVCSLRLSSEPRGIFFLLDGKTLLTVDAKGRVISFGLPDLQVQYQLSTQLTVHCADLSPTGMQLALGNREGVARRIGVEGLDQAPLVVTAAQRTRKSASRWQKLLGRTQSIKVFDCQCPACGHAFELEQQLPSEPAPCPQCGRALKYNRVTRAATMPVG